MINTKMKPVRRCSCRSCKAGLRTKGGSAHLAQTERRLRRQWAATAALILIDQEVADSIPAPMVGAGYTD